MMRCTYHRELYKQLVRPLFSNPSSQHPNISPIYLHLRESQLYLPTSSRIKMKFAITATIACLALANLGFAAPAASPVAADGIDQRSPNPEVDWKTKLGWDGKVTPIEKIGEIVSVSCFVSMVALGKYTTCTSTDECNGG